MSFLSQQKRLSVSTWSLHHHLGAPTFAGPASAPPAFDPTPLLQLPAQLANFGIHTLEICHFHLPSLDDTFLTQLRAELENHHIELWALLIDDGDLNSPPHAARDQKWMESWLPIAAKLGATNARIIAGKGKPTPENLAHSIKALNTLADTADTLGLQLLTENWFDLTSTPASTIHLLEGMQGRLGLCLDFGNWGGPSRPEKYGELAQIAPFARSCHTKAFFKDGEIDRADYQKVLEITREAGFSGPYTLIYDAGGDEWRGLEVEREVVEPYLV